MMNAEHLHQFELAYAEAFGFAPARVVHDPALDIYRYDWRGFYGTPVDHAPAPHRVIARLLVADQKADRYLRADTVRAARAVGQLGVDEAFHWEDDPNGDTRLMRGEGNGS